MSFLSISILDRVGFCPNNRHCGFLQ